jgi:hypothetical protein
MVVFTSNSSSGVLFDQDVFLNASLGRLGGGAVVASESQFLHVIDSGTDDGYDRGLVSFLPAKTHIRIPTDKFIAALIKSPRFRDEQLYVISKHKCNWMLFVEPGDRTQEKDSIQLLATLRQSVPIVFAAPLHHTRAV